MEKQSNQGAARPCQFIDLEKNNLSFSQNSHLNKNINGINEEMANLNIKEKGNEKIILKPRDYQQKIYDKAKNQNSIIYVETGKGKTFISIMLMAKHLKINIFNPFSNKSIIDKNKKIIFFVCDTSLIEQQKKAISSILEIEVGVFQGKKNKKIKSDYESFKKMWDSLNVFVAIPTIIYKFLSCGFIKIFDITMLIFDECHHTDDEHAYNKILNEFYFFYKKLKPNENLNYPRIYGLTASPLKKGIKGSVEASITKAMEKLCENLDAVIIIDPEMTNSNAKLMKPGESIEQYLKEDSYIEVKSHTDIPEYKKIISEVYNECFLKLIQISFFNIKNSYPEYYNKDLTEYSKYVINKFKSHNLEEYNIITEKYINFYNLRKLSILFLVFEKIQRQIFMILENLCLNSLILYFGKLIEIYNDLYVKKVKEEKNNLNIKEISGENNSLNLSNDNEEDNEEDDEGEKNLYNLKSSLIEEIKEVFINTYEKLRAYRDKERKNYISDRLNKLYLKIDDLFTKNNKSKFIIFIANRIVAHFLQPELTIYLKNKYKNKECQEIIGINKRKSNGGLALTPSLTLNQMNTIIKNFNEDKFNILIGTSAIEEGLDIQSCNAVLALVELRTPKSFIQIKGRARKSNSDFIIFTNNSKEGMIKIKEFLMIGQKINELFKDNIMKDFKKEDYILKKKDFLYIFDHRSHSKLSMGNVSIFYNEIIQQIKINKILFNPDIKIKEVKSLNTMSQYEYNGTVNVETDLDIGEKFPKTFEHLNNKENAQKMCFFYVLNTLKEKNYLDQYLKFVKNNY